MLCVASLLTELGSASAQEPEHEALRAEFITVCQKLLTSAAAGDRLLAQSVSPGTSKFKEYESIAAFAEALEKKEPPKENQNINVADETTIKSANESVQHDLERAADIAKQLGDESAQLWLKVVSSTSADLVQPMTSDVIMTLHARTNPSPEMAKEILLRLLLSPKKELKALGRLMLFAYQRLPIFPDERTAFATYLAELKSRKLAGANPVDDLIEFMLIQKTAWAMTELSVVYSEPEIQEAVATLDVDLSLASDDPNVKSPLPPSMAVLVSRPEWWVRYYVVLLISKHAELQSDELLSKVMNDPSERVRDVGRVLLFENRIGSIQ